MAAIIDFKGELNEIRAYLSRSGIPPSDHEIVLSKCKVNHSVHENYLNLARGNVEHRPAAIPAAAVEKAAVPIPKRKLVTKPTVVAQVDEKTRLARIRQKLSQVPWLNN